MSKILRCAIYTRKSHEEGLDQAFNSLDAQREAGEDYIRSQKHQGWSIVRRRYDDGGYSGATMRRPRLKALLEDIEHGDVDVVVVYKVDRLSRSLGDFARMMQLFEKHEVSFVSVTQQFNTTTSMGRLTMNMLLSFAQFEREVTGERIRDKVAATRKKGMWTGGNPPLGYRPHDRKLVVIPEEAELVRRIFEGYVGCGSLVELARQLNATGATTKRWRSSKGRWHGGRPLTTKYLYGILTNPIYIGRVVHKSRTWPGQHEAIIDQSLWSEVRRKMTRQDGRSQHRWSHPYLLKGKLRTHEGFAMSPGSVQRPGKKQGEKRLVRYYVSQKAIKHGYKRCSLKTINASRLDDLVRALVLDQLGADLRPRLATQEPVVRDHWIRAMVAKVALSPTRLVVHLDPARIEECRDRPWSDGSGSNPQPCARRPDVTRRGGHVVLSLALQIKRARGRCALLGPDGRELIVPAAAEPPEHIVRAIGLAYHWHERLTKTDMTTGELAEEVGVAESRIKKLLALTNLGPRVLRRVLTGAIPSSLTLSALVDASRELDWGRQAAVIGIDARRY